MADFLTPSGELDPATIEMLNTSLLENLRDPSMIKQATDAVDAFTRMKMREEGFLRRVMPPLPVTNDELDRQVDTDQPVVIVDKEPMSPAAVTVPFQTMPTGFYITGPRYRLMFSRILTPRFQKDVDELRTWIMDIRQVLSDNALKDVMAEEDSKFVAGINQAMVGPDAPVPWNAGTVQWETISGGLTRDTWMDSLKIPNRSPARFEAAVVLMNLITHKELLKFDRNEMGGDLSEKIIKDGWAETTFTNRKLLVTIKRDLVPDGTTFMFARPSGMGKFLILEDTTMFIRREAFLLDFFCYESISAGIGNSAALARADFAGVG